MNSKEFIVTVSRYRIYNKVAKNKILDHKIHLIPHESIKKKIVREIERNAYQVGKKVRIKNINEIQRGVIEDVCVDFNLDNFKNYNISLRARCGDKIFKLKLNKKTNLTNSEIEI